MKESSIGFPYLFNPITTSTVLNELAPTSQLVILLDHQFHVFGMDRLLSIMEHLPKESTGKLVFLSGHPFLVIEAPG